jgi:hypothetical protein
MLAIPFGMAVAPLGFMAGVVDCGVAPGTGLVAPAWHNS